MKCPWCDREIDVSNRISGDIVMCPDCEQMFIVRFTPIIKKKEDDAE